MIPVQKLSDIEIPDIEIDDGWPVSDVKTIQDCDDAFAYLMSASASIEYAVDLEDAKPAHMQNFEWKAKARCALKYKKAALSIVNTIRGRINSERDKAFQNERDRVLLEYIRTRVSDEQFLHWVASSGCNRSARFEVIQPSKAKQAEPTS